MTTAIGTDPQVYPVLEDTLLLCRAVLDELRPGDRVLEIGTGSGYICASLPEGHFVVGTDISPHAVREAARRGVVVVRADLFAGICGSFDLVVCNPPYLPTDASERLDDWLERALDGGADGRELIDRFIEGVGDVLAPGGRVLLLVSSLTGISQVRRKFKREGFWTRIIARSRLEGEELVVIRAEKRKPRLPRLAS